MTVGFKEKQKLFYELEDFLKIYFILICFQDDKYRYSSYQCLHGCFLASGRVIVTTLLSQVLCLFTPLFSVCVASSNDQLQ